MAKYIVQIVVTGIQIVGRSFARALRTEFQASQTAAHARQGQGGTSGNKQAAADAITGMSLSEAKQVLNLTNYEDVQKNYDHLFNVNEKSNGGSLYLQSKQTSMWLLAAWLEGDLEEEGVVPMSWVDTETKTVYWPNKQVISAMRNEREPEEDWITFPLIKVKYKSANKAECEEYDLTTTAEVSEDDILQMKRMIKNKTYIDHVTGSPVLPAAPLKFSLKTVTSTSSKLGSTGMASGSARELFKQIVIDRPQVMSTPTRKSLNKKRTEVSPMSTAKFQRQVIYLLAEMRSRIEELGQKSQHEVASFNLNQMSSLECLHTMEENLTMEVNRELMLTRLGQIGGSSLRDATNKILQRLMTNELTSKLSMNGSKGKESFRQSALLSVVKETILKKYQNGTEKDIEDGIAKFLEYAPDRLGGAGRRKSLE